MKFHDHFSDASKAYRQSRPGYPREVFEWLAQMSPGNDVAWDCACGNGQASVPLAEFFERVIATDASAAQLAEAETHPSVEYRVAPAESSGLNDNSIDLCTVAQAAHWLDANRFHAEVGRVLRPRGLLAYITYGIHHVSPEFDEVMDHYYCDIVGPFWPPERIHVDQHYKDLPFPFSKIETPHFVIALDWSLDQVLEYVSTWSASKAFKQANQQDPRALVIDQFNQTWGDPEHVRTVRWPLTVVAGYSGFSSGS